MNQFTCPRCAADTSAEFYGPCESCCNQLHTTQRIEPKIVEGSSGEYKMNVTPNAVALKADD